MVARLGEDRVWLTMMPPTTERAEAAGTAPVWALGDLAQDTREAAHKIVSTVFFMRGSVFDTGRDAHPVRWTDIFRPGLFNEKGLFHDGRKILKVME